MNLLFPVWKFPHPGTIGTSMQVEITHLFLKLLIPIIQKYLWQMQIALPRSQKWLHAPDTMRSETAFFFFVVVNNSPRPQPAHMEATKELL